MKKILFVVNKKTGAGKNSSKVYEAVREFAAAGYATTICPIDIGLRMEAADFLREEQYDKVICMGGDGTLSHTVTSVMELEDRPVIGYIPAGTTNDFSHNIGLGKDIKRAALTAVYGDRFSFDIGKFNDRYVTYVAVFGAFSDVSYGTNQYFKNVFGHAAYVIKGIAAAPKSLSDKSHMKIETDDETIEGDFVFGAIGNTFTVGGFRLNEMKRENLHDGYFELILIPAPKSKSELPRIAASILRDKVESTYVIFRRIKRARITAEQNTAWTIDGEEGGNITQADFEVAPEAVTVMVPER
ncbi:MAG: YegS/Rv2252/BmrU family lipid kinase [Anaerovoracaceae bacterium]|nr:YegS/Rv2252/BmrU family lipid kinase [Anaerovoracaceae bacterium]